ncbi:hypothetical protein AAC387_Pa05g3722 [Persea americana]
MEDIWKDITLTGTTLQGQPSSKHRDPNTGIFFQDLLSSTSSNHLNPTNEITAVEFSLFPSTPPMQRPITALNLNSVPEKSHYQPKATDDFNHRRHKRMIKNREAAARSRARKQAYTDEMELTVAHLMKENAKLRKEVQQAQRCLGTSAEPLTEKRPLHRTSTAPF